MDAAKQQAVEYLKTHRTMTLATVSPDGNPLAHTVEYACEGATVYFATRKTTRKARNIQANPHVAYTVDEDYQDWLQIQGVQMEGMATVLTNPAEIERATSVYLAKFPFVADFPPNPDLIFVKVEPVGGFFLDYAKGFAHRDEIEF